MTTKNFLILLAVIVSVVIGYYSFLVYSKKQLSQKQPGVPITETTINNQGTSNEAVIKYELPKGEQVYNVSHGKVTTGPRMSQVIFSPLSFDKGETQTIKIVFPEKENVGSAVVFITSDNQENQKTTLTKDKIKNTWSGEWVTNDTVRSRYSVKFSVVGQSGEYSNIMTFL